MFLLKNGSLFLDNSQGNSIYFFIDKLGFVVGRGQQFAKHTELPPKNKDKKFIPSIHQTKDYR